MQTKRVRLRGALLLALVLGLLALPALPATAAVGESPTLEVAPATCDLLGATDILVRAGGLVKGETYLVSVSVASTRSPIDAKEISGDSSTASLIFENLLNGDSYAVSIANAANTLSAATTVTLPVCDLPTLPDQPATPDTHAVDGPLAPDDLALTSTAPLVPAFGAVGLIQVGVVLLGVAIWMATARGRKA